MPHFIAEYTDNIEAEADLPGLFEKVHACLGASGVFPLGGIRSRGVRLDTWRMADGKHDYAFVHMTLKVGAGRDLETRRQVAEALFRGDHRALRRAPGATPAGAVLRTHRTGRGAELQAQQRA